MHKFLKKWYKDLAGAPWYDTHKSDDGYYGYWSFEAACAVILLEIDDDKELHEYLYYPKDLISFFHSFKPTKGEEKLLSKYNRIAIKAGEKAPISGFWFTVISDNSRKYFEAGEILPEIKDQDWGEVFWQFASQE